MGRHTDYFPWLMFIPALILVTFGLVTLLSLSPTFFWQQFIYAVISIGVFFIFSRLDFALFHYLDKFVYVFCLLFLGMTFFGSSVRGSLRWIDIGPLKLQPSELIKPLIIASWASFMVRFPPVNLRRLGTHFSLFLLPFLLIFKQPDLGNAIVYAAIWLAMLVAAGIPFLYLTGITIVGIVILPLGYRLLHEYQKLRLLTFLNPFLDPRGAGYNGLQAMIAVGSGQLLGRGFGRGTQTLLKFLPEYHTDFIFATFTEEFGLLGAMVVLALFFALLWQILAEARKQTPETMSFLYLVGFFSLIFTHVFINVGMNLGLMPITGITLPFMSAGGSSLLSLWMGLGMIHVAIRHSR